MILIYSPDGTNVYVYGSRGGLSRYRRRRGLKVIVKSYS